MITHRWSVVHLLYVVNNSVTVSMLSSEAITDYLVPVSVWCMVAVVVGRGGGNISWPDFSIFKELSLKHSVVTSEAIRIDN